MKIAILCNTSWNIYNFRSYLVREILKRHHVLLIAPRDKYTSLLEAYGVEFHHININTKGQNPFEEI
ncbi:MAG: hypothetical protein KJP26_14940, partial [Maribacter sp.]|nr:hypothetical protein [Maribacter sp.]